VHTQKRKEEANQVMKEVKCLMKNVVARRQFEEDFISKFAGVRIERFVRVRQLDIG
jgi:hypothetical protein